VRCERGQASIEWVGLVLLASLALGALATAVPVVDGRSFGALVSQRIVCAATGEPCDGGHRELARAFGERDAALLRRHAPGLVYEPGERQLPVDWRRCRRPACARAPDDRDLDVNRTDAGHPATAFAHVVRRGGRTYLQYWLYYPDSNTTVAASDRIWRAVAPRRFRYPGYHPDDWEGYAVRLDGSGRVAVRSSSHGHWQWCKRGRCRGRWGAPTGWTRVSRGSHSGHVPVYRIGHGRRPLPAIPGVNLRERTTTADGLRLVPLRHRGRGRYRPLDRGVRPPWRKRVTREPESEGS
jgi:hypothetical protein